MTTDRDKGLSLKLTFSFGEPEILTLIIDDEETSGVMTNSDFYASVGFKSMVDYMREICRQAKIKWLHG